MERSEFGERLGIGRPLTDPELRDAIFFDHERVEDVLGVQGDVELLCIHRELGRLEPKVVAHDFQSRCTLDRRIGAVTGTVVRSTAATRGEHSESQRHRERDPPTALPGMARTA